MSRWWSADGPTSVLEMLRPGSDPKKDLGLALLAVHKAGEQACRLVAQTPMADEYVLAGALAETRATIAASAVQTIAKGVGGAPYAGLLLADLLDDAEVAALALYRTCLSKSVAPPIAAERVGLVFGVASRDLSKYSALASDPKANPRAVADLADRTLFGYVAKVVQVEHVPAKDVVSKAPGDGGYLDEHNVEHGPGGQFVRERGRPGAKQGIDLNQMFAEAEEQQVAPGQATSLPSTAAPAQVAAPRQQRTMRTQRQQRKMRTQPVQSAQAGSLSGASLQGQGLQGRSLRSDLLSVGLKGHELALATEVELDPSPMPLAGMERNVPRLDVGEGGPSAALNKAVSFILPDSEFLSVAREAGDSADGSNVLRAGPLEEYAGRARLYDDGRGGMHEHHEAGVEHTLDLLNGQVEGAPRPLVGTVPGHLVADGTGLGYDDQKLRAAKQTFVEQQAAKLGLRVNVAQEISKVRHAKLKGDMGQVALVWRPAYTDSRGRQQQAPIPGVVEVVIKAGAARGEVSAAGRVTLNGASPLRMHSLFDKSEAARANRLQVWDDKLGAFRTVVTLSAASEEDIAAASWRYRKASDYLDEHNVEHGPQGRFVRERAAQPGIDLQHLFDSAQEQEQSAPAREVRMAKPRQMRTQRMARVQRRAPMAVPGLTASTLQGQGLQGARLSGGLQGTGLTPSALKAHVLARKQTPAPRKNDLDQMLFLDSEVDYGVLPPRAMDALLQSAGMRGFVKDGTVVELSSEQQSILEDFGAESDERATIELAMNAVSTWNENRRQNSAEALLVPSKHVQERPLLTHELTDREELSMLSAHLVDIMDQDSTIQVLNVRMSPARGGRYKVEVTSNIEGLPEQHVIDYESVADPSSVTALVSVGSYRIQNKYGVEFLMGFVLDQCEKYDAPVMETIANPIVRRWRAEQDQEP